MVTLIKNQFTYVAVNVAFYTVELASSHYIGHCDGMWKHSRCLLEEFRSRWITAAVLRVS